MNTFLMVVDAALLLTGVFLIYQATYVGETLLGWFTVVLAVAMAFCKWA